MTQFVYHSDVLVEDLAIGECVMRRALTADGTRFWHLWFRVNREDNGQPDDFCVPMNPNGPFIESGPGGKTWGLTQTSPGTWQVDPSINVLATREVNPGEHPSPSLWHQTPLIIGVPITEPWIVGLP